MTNNVAVENGQKNRAATLAESAIQKLADALERGESADLKRYLETMSRFYNYSFYNCMLIASQRPDATHVAGFHKWHEFGRFVKKGEKGIAILAPIVRKVDDEETGEKTRRVVGFRAVYVFDVKQTDGEPLPTSGIKSAAGEPGEYLEALRSFATGSNIAVEFVDDLGGARGVSLGGKIQLLANLTPAETFATLAHEVAHELLHRGERRAQTSKTIRETEAEAVAFVVATGIGLESPGTVDYIRLYDGNRDTLAESLTHIQKAASEILGALVEGPASEVDERRAEVAA